MKKLLLAMLAAGFVAVAHAYDDELVWMYDDNGYPTQVYNFDYAELNTGIAGRSEVTESASDVVEYFESRPWHWASLAVEVNFMPSFILLVK